MVKIEKNEQGILTLIREGVKLCCPFQNKLAIPAQGIQGMGININISPCSSQCPFFNHLDNKIFLTCTGSEKFLLIKNFDYE